MVYDTVILILQAIHSSNLQVLSFFYFYFYFFFFDVLVWSVLMLRVSKHNQAHKKKGFFVCLCFFVVLTDNGVRGYRPLFNWRHQNAGTPSFCNMSLALAGFYNRVLTAFEVAALYAAGKDRQCLTEAPSQPPTKIPSASPILPPTLAPHSPYKRCAILPKPRLLWEFDDTHGWFVCFVCVFAHLRICAFVDIFVYLYGCVTFGKNQSQKTQKHNFFKFGKTRVHTNRQTTCFAFFFFFFL